jgi:putative Holliday junction resolvase
MINTVMGLDFGLRKIGIAVGQTITGTASPVAILKNQDGHPGLPQFEKLVRLWRPDAFIIGIPLNMDDSPSPIAVPAEACACWLETFTSLPVYRVDERLTTKAAKSERASLHSLHAKRPANGPVDALAAVLIVEHWLGQTHTTTL